MRPAMQGLEISGCFQSEGSLESTGTERALVEDIGHSGLGIRV